MSNDIDKFNQEVLDVLGKDALVIAMEELAELSQAISKVYRGKGNMDNLAEEIADVMIVLDWVKTYTDISYEAIDSYYINKLNRIDSRLKEGTLC